MNSTKLMAIYFALFYVAALNAGASRLIEVGQLAMSGKQSAIEEWFNKPFEKPELGLALNAASRKGHLGIVTFLVEKGADKIDRQMALETACKNKHKDVAQFLIDQGGINGDIPLCKNSALNLAEPSTTEIDPVKFSIFYTAVKNGDLFTASLYIDQMNLSKTGDDGLTPLQAAAKHNHPGIVKLLLNRRVPLDTQDKAGNTALHYACRHGNLDVVELLIKQGADYKIKNTFGKRPIDNYSFSGNKVSELEFLTKVHKLIEGKEKDLALLEDLEKRILQLEKEEAQNK